MESCENAEVCLLCRVMVVQPTKRARLGKVGVNMTYVYLQFSSFRSQAQFEHSPHLSKKAHGRKQSCLAHIQLRKLDLSI